MTYVAFARYAGAAVASFEEKVLRVAETGQVDDAYATQAQQRHDPIAGKLGADPQVVAHLHVRILAFRGVER